MLQPNMYAHQRGLRTIIRCVYSVRGTQMSGPPMSSNLATNICQTNTIADGYVVIRTAHRGEVQTDSSPTGALRMLMSVSRT